MTPRAWGFTMFRIDPRAARRAARPHARRRGMMSYVALVALIFFTALFALLMDNSRVVVEKIEAQNAADAAAYSSALWLARGMNAVTATNHLMGEMMSLVVVHEAIAGKD